MQTSYLLEYNEGTLVLLESHCDLLVVTASGERLKLFIMQNGTMFLREKS